MHWEFHPAPIWLQQPTQAGEFQELLQTQWEKAGEDSNAGWGRDRIFLETKSLP